MNYDRAHHSTVSDGTNYVVAQSRRKKSHAKGKLRTYTRTNYPRTTQLRYESSKGMGGGSAATHAFREWIWICIDTWVILYAVFRLLRGVSLRDCDTRYFEGAILQYDNGGIGNYSSTLDSKKKKQASNQAKSGEVLLV